MQQRQKSSKVKLQHGPLEDIACTLLHPVLQQSFVGALDMP